MAILHIEESHLEALSKLISQLNDRQSITFEEANHLSRAASKKITNTVFEKGVSWGQAAGYPEIYRKSEEDFFSHQKSINDNLFEQVKLFSQFVDKWFLTGDYPPPNYANRIVTILRKAKFFDVEKEFLVVYFKHFWSPYGSSKDQKLGERAKKIGVNIPAIPSTSSWYRPKERGWAAELNIQHLSIDIEKSKSERESTANYNVTFYCLQCACTVLDVDDENNQLSSVKCKKCTVKFGEWGSIQTWISRISKSYFILHGSN
jgi:hypothetical protein